MVAALVCDAGTICAMHPAHLPQLQNVLVSLSHTENAKPDSNSTLLLEVAAMQIATAYSSSQEECDLKLFAGSIASGAQALLLGRRRARGRGRLLHPCLDLPQHLSSTHM